MTPDNATLAHHPAPHRDRAGVVETGFGLLGGPAAWFAQVCAGSALSNWPCFPSGQRLPMPLTGFAWTWAAIGIISLLAFVIAVAAMLVSLQVLRRTRDEAHGGHAHLLETGSGRTRFLALWGTLLGGGFAVATAFTGVAYFVLPRCGG